MGHFSLAKAVEETLKKAGWQTKIHFSQFQAELSLYRYLASFFKPIWKLWFSISQNPLIIKISSPWLFLRKRNEIKKALTEFKPDLVISTYFIYNWSLAKLKKEYNFKFINLVADPRTIHRATVCLSADLNLVYDQKAKEFLKSWGITDEKIAPIGWLVREKFYKVTRQKTKKNFFSILVGAGSWGAVSTIKILPFFLELPIKTELILVAGKNRQLYQAYRLFKFAVERKILKPKKELKISVLGFSQKIEQLISKADLVIGKAGPNFLFETVAVGKPFLAVSWVPGQEEGNLEIIKEKKLGWAIRDIELLPSLLNKIIADKKFCQLVLENIKKEREINLQAGERLRKALGEVVS